MKKLLLLLFLPLLVLTNYAYGYTDKYYSDGSGGSSEGLGILFIIIVFIVLLFGLYIFIESFIKDRDFRKSVLDKSKEGIIDVGNKSKEEVVGLVKGLPNLPKDMASEVKTQSTLDQILFWAGVVLLFLIVTSLIFGLV